MRTYSVVMKALPPLASLIRSPTAAIPAAIRTLMKRLKAIDALPIGVSADISVLPRVALSRSAAVGIRHAAAAAAAEVPAAVPPERLQKAAAVSGE